MAEHNLTAERLRELLHYDPETGVFTWRESRHNHVRVGTIAGHNNHGYLRIHIGDKSYGAHRLAWLHVYGKWPSDQIDHIDGKPLNNRIINLREAIHAQNVQNQYRPHTNGQSGLLGVTHSFGKWKAQINVSGKKIYLGTFESKETAHAAYLAAKRSFHGFGEVAKEATRSPRRFERADCSFSGVKGVYRSGPKWRAHIGSRYIGTFDTISLASAAIHGVKES